jgi:hypothetical protein
VNRARGESVLADSRGDARGHHWPPSERQRPNKRDAVIATGQQNVDQCDAGTGALVRLKRLADAPDTRDDVHLSRRVDQLSQRASDARIVIDDEHTDEGVNRHAAESTVSSHRSHRPSDPTHPRHMT